MSKELFMQMRELETLQYSPDFTKKDAVKKGKEVAKEILDKGNITPVNALSNIVRLKEFVNALETELRDNIEIAEAQTENGVEFTISNTGDRLNYEKDELYKEIKERLKDRENLLKLAYKSKDTIYDSEGVEVPKVPVKTFGKEVIRLKF